MYHHAYNAIPRDSSFLTPTVVVGDAPFPRKLALKVIHPTFEHNNFDQQYPLSASRPSTVIASKNVQLALTGSRPRAFQRAIDEPCTLPLSPPKVGTKRDIAVCASKIQLLSIKVCYKASLYENFQRQSCSYIIPLSNSP